MPTMPPPPLCGWLGKRYKRTGDFDDSTVVTYTQRYFIYNADTAKLCYFRRAPGDSDTANPPVLGWASLAAVTAIVPGGDAGMREFRMVLPTCLWELVTAGPEETVDWVEGLLTRKQRLTRPPAGEPDAWEDEATISAEQLSGVPADPATPPSLTAIAAATAAVDDAPALAPPAATPSITSGATLGEYEQLRVARDDYKDRIKTLRSDLNAKAAVAELLRDELATSERMVGLLNEAADFVRKQLEAEREAFRAEVRGGAVRGAELQARLLASQLDLAHTRALLDLDDHRLTAARELLCHYKSLADGFDGDQAVRARCWREQLDAGAQALAQSELRNKSLADELHAVYERQSLLEAGRL